MRITQVRGIRRIIPIILLGAALGLQLGCALSQGGRHAAVVGDTAVYAALGGVQDAADSLHRNGQMPDAEHQAFNAKLVPVLEVGRAVNRTIRVWPIDQPAPPELRALVDQLETLSKELVDVVVSEAARAALKTKIEIATNIAKAILSALPPAPSQEN